MITDTICSLRPNLGLFATAAEAFEAAMDLEKKFHSRIGEVLREGACFVGGEEVDGCMCVCRVFT